MHPIRLRGPWDAQPLADSPGLVRLTRRFHRPTGLDGGERVWLAIDAPAAPSRVVLNGVLAGQPSRSSPFRWDITDLLQPYNELQVDTAGPSPGDVRLEIES
jgi:hypothetical protein